jgi:predicted outer membrane repeat protein
LNGGFVTFENCVFDSCGPGPYENTGGAGFVGMGLDANHRSSAIFRSCVFSHNKAHVQKTGGAIDGYTYGEMTFEHCTFFGNFASTGSALSLGTYMQVAITNCTFSGNRSRSGENGGTLHTYGGSSDLVSLYNTILAFSSRGAAIHVGGGSPSVEMSCCDVYGNAGGDWVDYIADQQGINGNIWGDPGFCDTLSGNFSIQTSSPCMPDSFLGCGLIGSREDACSGEVLVVADDGDGDFPTIQAALASCHAWDVVELLDGEFTGEGNRDVIFPKKPVTIRSRNGDPSRCTIAGQDIPPSYHFGFRFRQGNGQEAMIRGVRLVGFHTLSLGGALQCPNGSPRIAGCLITGNSANDGGGALYCDSLSAPLLVACTLSGNQAPLGGGVYCGEMAPRPALQNSIVAFSPAGGAVYCDGEAAPVLSCSDVYGNTGGDWWQTCIEEQRDLRWNFNVDPCFCGEGEGDYSLREDSPCVGTWGSCGTVGAMQIGCAEGQCEQPQMSDVLERSSVPIRGGLLRSVPNPFTPGGRICYSIPNIAADSRVVLTLHDTAGRLVRSLMDGALVPGEHSVSWDGTSNLARPVPAGVYYCRLSAGGRTAVRPLMLVR